MARSGLVVGKNRACSMLPLSSLLWIVLMSCLVEGSIICKEGIRALAVSVGVEEMYCAACQMLDLSKPLS